MNFSFKDAENIIKEITDIACDAKQEFNFAMDNREALKSKNTMVISNRLKMTNERYRIAIEILSMIIDIAREIAPPPTRRAPSLLMSECTYCYRYNQQESIECKECSQLTYRTDMIPVYAVMLKAGEKGIEWGADWFIKQIADEKNVGKVKERFYVRRNRLL